MTKEQFERAEVLIRELCFVNQGLACLEIGAKNRCNYQCPSFT